MEIIFIILIIDCDELDKDVKVKINFIIRKKYKVKIVYFISKLLVIINEDEIKEKI